jgi:hypothetical protein
MFEELLRNPLQQRLEYSPMYSIWDGVLEWGKKRCLPDFKLHKEG